MRKLQNFVGGAYCDAEDGPTRAPDRPQHGRGVRRGARLGCRRRRPALAGGGRGLLVLAAHHAVGAQPGPHPHRRRPRGPGRGAGPGREREHGQALRADHGRGDPAHGRPDPLLRRRRPAPRGHWPPAEYMAGHTSFIRREPIGVCGAVTPWNYPMMMAVWKLAPALAAGNTMVLKPSDTTPVTAAAHGRDHGRAPAARRLQRGVRRPRHRPGPGGARRRPPWCRSPARCGPAWRWPPPRRPPSSGSTSSSGGKAPVIVFDDADLAAAAEGIAGAGYFNAGQDCTAATRVLAGPRVHDDLVAALVEQAEGTTVGGHRQRRRRLRAAEQREPARAGARLPRAHAGARLGGDRRRAGG